MDWSCLLYVLNYKKNLKKKKKRKLKIITVPGYLWIIYIEKTMCRACSFLYKIFLIKYCFGINVWFACVTFPHHYFKRLLSGITTTVAFGYPIWIRSITHTVSPPYGVRLFRFRRYRKKIRYSESTFASLREFINDCRNWNKFWYDVLHKCVVFYTVYI